MVETLREGGQLSEEELFERLGKPRSDSNLSLLRQLIEQGLVTKSSNNLLQQKIHE
jgi:ATP-dependent DNA helicase RecQ